MVTKAPKFRFDLILISYCMFLFQQKVIQGF